MQEAERLVTEANRDFTYVSLPEAPHSMHPQDSPILGRVEKQRCASLSYEIPGRTPCEQLYRSGTGPTDQLVSRCVATWAPIACLYLSCYQ